MAMPTAKAATTTKTLPRKRGRCLLPTAPLRSTGLSFRKPDRKNSDEKYVTQVTKKCRPYPFL